MNQFYDKLKSQIDIVDVIGKYVSVTKKNSGGICICPFHNDTKPSLSISSKLQIFNCFVCETKGDAITFVSKYEHIPYFQAAKKIIEDFGLGNELLAEINQNSNVNFEHEREYLINEKVGLFFHNFLFNHENKFALDYLSQRQLDEKLIKHFNLGYAVNDDHIIIEMLLNPEFIKLPYGENACVTAKDLIEIGIAKLNTNGDYCCVFKNRIMIPIYDASQHLVGFSGRALDDNNQPKYLNTQTTNIFNKDSLLYNYQNVLKLDDYTSIYLVEGYMDVFGLYRGGIENAVATMGVALTVNHLKLLKYNNKIKTIILSYDNDDAGREAILKAGKLIGKDFQVLVVKPFKQLAKDFDELYCCHGKTKVNECAQNLIDFVSYALIVLAAESRNDYVKMKDFLNQAFEIIYRCGQTIEHENYFSKIKDLFDKSSYFQNKYTTESIATAYQEFCHQQERNPTLSQAISKKTEFKKYSSKSNISKDDSRYNYQNLNLSPRVYAKKFPNFGTWDKYIRNDLFLESQNNQKSDPDFETQKNKSIEKIVDLENCLLFCFYEYKKSLHDFDVINDLKFSFLTPERQQLYNLIKDWYSKHNSRATMAYDQIDVDEFCFQEKEIIDAYQQMLLKKDKLMNFDDPNIWKHIIFDWLIARTKLVILLLTNETKNNKNHSTQFYDELNEAYQILFKLNQKKQSILSK